MNVTRDMIKDYLSVIIIVRKGECLDISSEFSYTTTCKEKSFTGGALLKEKSK